MTEVVDRNKNPYDDNEFIEELSEEASYIIDNYADKEEDGKEGINFSRLIEKHLGAHQLEQVSINRTSFRKHDIIDTPYDPLLLSCLLEKNTRLNKAIEIRARNTLGLGWNICDNDDFDEFKKDIEAEMKATYKLKTFNLKNEIDLIYRKTKRRLLYPNKNHVSFLDLSYRMKVDEESTGNGYWEIIRDKGGFVLYINHVPSHTIRITKDENYVMLRGKCVTYFKKFGDPRLIDSATGKVTTKSKLKGCPASEIIHFKIFSPRSSYYGIPRWVGAVAAITGNKLSAERNVAFFENDAVGRVAIVVSNGKLDSASVQSIKGFMSKKGKGTQNAHRIMVLQADQKKAFGTKGDAVKIEVVPLTVGKSDDASFLSYRQANNEEIREALGISSPFFSSEGVNRSSANELKRITIEQEFIPDIVSHEYLINSTLMSQFKEDREFPIPPKVIRYVRPRGIDELESVTKLNNMTKTGSITINEMRKELGYHPLPKKFKWGELPFQFAAIFFQQFVAMTGAQNISGSPAKGATQQMPNGEPLSINNGGDDFNNRDKDENLNESIEKGDIRAEILNLTGSPAEKMNTLFDSLDRMTGGTVERPF